MLLFFFLLTHCCFPSHMNAALFLSVHTQTFVLFLWSGLSPEKEAGVIAVFVLLLLKGFHPKMSIQIPALCRFSLWQSWSTGKKTFYNTHSMSAFFKETTTCKSYKLTQPCKNVQEKAAAFSADRLLELPSVSPFCQQQLLLAEKTESPQPGWLTADIY